MSLHFLHYRNLQPSFLRPKDAPTERLSLASLGKCRQEPVRLSPSPCCPRSPDGPRPRLEYVSPRRIATLPTIAPRTASGLTPKLSRVADAHSAPFIEEWAFFIFNS